MAKIRPIKRSFNAGILSPVMYGQVDFDKWASAVKYMKNFIPLPQGPARRRGGTQYAGSVKNSSDRVWLASFQFSTTEAFILEFGPGYIRFWYNHAQLLDGDNNILEIETPWGADDLTRNGKFGLSLQQSADVIYITCTNGNYPVHKLTRNTNTNWSLAEAGFSGGHSLILILTNPASFTPTSSGSGLRMETICLTAPQPLQASATSLPTQIFFRLRM